MTFQTSGSSGAAAALWCALALTLAGLPPKAAAQIETEPSFRLFTARDGLRDTAVSTISTSPRGNIWINHGGLDEISEFDGYSIHRLPSPNHNNYRVYESRAGQLWSLDPLGLTLYDGSQWVRHPVAEIELAAKADPIRSVRQISLAPEDQNHLLFLLYDRLMEYDAALKQTVVIKLAADAGIGRFSEMTESKDQRLWITGAQGLARISLEANRLTPATPWEIHPVDPSLQVENLARPFPYGAGGVITVASENGSSTKRVPLVFDGSQYHKFPAENENLRQAWPGWDGDAWAYSYDSLFHFDLAAASSTAREPSAYPVKDVAAEMTGAFWLATAGGLIRLSPPLWQRPKEAASAEGAVHGMVEDKAGSLWLAFGKGLLRITAGQKSQWFKWPENFDAEFQTSDNLFLLPNQRLAVGAEGTPLIFDALAEKFSAWPSSGESAAVKLLGPAESDSIWVATLQEGRAMALRQFDGGAFTRTVELTNRMDLSFAITLKNGDSWFGGDGGLALLRDDSLQYFLGNSGVFKDGFSCALDLGGGNTLFGGSDKILGYTNGVWRVQASGLPKVNRLAQAKDGHLWAATSVGLWVSMNGAWLANDVAEGLPGSVVTGVLEDRAGQIWAATPRGISRYEPASDTSPPRTLPPVRVPPGKTTPERSASFLFAGLDKWRQTPSDRLLFSSRIDDGPWSPFNEAASRAFENLRPGNHRLEVRSMDRAWNEDPDAAHLDFAIVLPWYEDSRTLAVSLVGLALVSLFAGLAVNRHLQLLRSYQEVERIVALRTKELERANTELIHSQKMRALGTLAAGIAHDFNSILSIIQGSAQIIEKNLGDIEKIHTRVDRIKAAVAQGSGIVTSVLGLSKVREQDLTECDLNGVVERTIRLLGDRLTRDFTIEFNPAQALPLTKAVPELLQQMLLNLLLNAADAMEAPGAIRIRTGRSRQLPQTMALSPAAAPEQLFMTIEDAGHGISSEILPRIFEPFFTTKALSSRRGAGLGLTMVYELAKEFGYGLAVNSEVGKGSRFTIFFPLKPPPLKISK